MRWYVISKCGSAGCGFAYRIPAHRARVDQSLYSALITSQMMMTLLSASASS